MRILSTTRRLLQYSGFVPFECRHGFALHIAQNILILTNFATTIVSGTVFALKTNSFYDFSTAIYLNIAESSVFFVHITLLSQRSRIVKFIDRCEATINARIAAFPNVKSIYTTSNRNMESWSADAIKIFGSFTISFIVPYFLYSVWIILSDEHSNDELTLIYLLP